MKLWLLIIGTILVYITVSNDAKTLKFCCRVVFFFTNFILRLNGDILEGNPTSLVDDGMTRVKRAVDGRVKKGRKNHAGVKKEGSKYARNPNGRMAQIVRRKPRMPQIARRKRQRVARRG